MDIITDPSCSRTMGPDITMAPVAADTMQISMAPAAEWFSDTNMALGGNRSHMHQLRHWLLYGTGPGLDGTMTSGDSTGHSDQHDPSDGTVVRHPRGHSFQPRHWASV